MDYVDVSSAWKILKKNDMLVPSTRSLTMHKREARKDLTVPAVYASTSKYTLDTDAMSELRHSLSI
jgi:hypothetical protein